ncbi:cAMP-dependent protein kinase catalytic subunit alpha-like isoform X2 [Zophobas morio]|uniref:cAMP-dependent protein kinase catalytic subunit alpha-like isoform X2 n=1 Tax=Zophobas morio TaxID=2755281 RepID=UPI0030838098
MENIDNKKSDICYIQKRHKINKPTNLLFSNSGLLTVKKAGEKGVTSYNSEERKLSDYQEIKKGKPKLNKNHSYGNIFSLWKDNAHRSNENEQSSSGKEKPIPRTTSFKEVWEAVSHFHLPHGHSFKSRHNLKSPLGTKFLEMGRLGFNHFTVVKQIGSGSFGRVYLCKHKVTGELVVIKALDKRFVVKTKQESQVMEEKHILKLLGQHGCPFTVKALASFQDLYMLYFVMEYIAGGELFAHLEAARHHRFSEKRARYYVAELILALKYMHEKEHIVYRDIKPENMLLDKKGHLKLIDFGFAKQLGGEEKTYTFCGTPDYLAPEVITRRGYNYEADLWSLGVLIYELVVGHAPFVTVNPHSKEVDYKAILTGQFFLPSHLSTAVKDLIVSLLQVDRNYRLGAKNGLSDVMNHPWFAGVDWGGMLKKTVKPPKPYHFKKGLVNIQLGGDPSKLGDVDQSLFTHFDFNLETESDLSDDVTSASTRWSSSPQIANGQDTHPPLSASQVGKSQLSSHSAELFLVKPDKESRGLKKTVVFSIGGDESEEYGNKTSEPK